jgi:hypothetical protein
MRQHRARHCAGYCAVALAWLLAGCATAPLPATGPFLVHATLMWPESTEWLLDHCTGGDPVRLDRLRATEGCVPVGSEINNVLLADADLVGKGRAPNFRAAYVSHGMFDAYTKTAYFVVQTAPPALRADTGLAFMVGDHDNYDPQKNCLVSHGWTHLTSGGCRDPAFHERTKNQCMPVEAYMAHYGLR